MPVEFLAALSEVSGWLGLYRQKMASPPKRAVNQIEFDEKEQDSAQLSLDAMAAGKGRRQWPGFPSDRPATAGPRRPKGDL